MDMVEVSQLLNKPSNHDDISVMLNFERLQNGASKKWLQSN